MIISRGFFGSGIQTGLSGDVLPLHAILGFGKKTKAGGRESSEASSLTCVTVSAGFSSGPSRLNRICLPGLPMWSGLPRNIVVGSQGQTCQESGGN